MQLKLIAVVSKDGFIAKKPGDVPANWTSNEEKKYFKNDINKCDWAVMGRTTHELSYKENSKRIIFSNSIKNYKFLSENHILLNPENFSFIEMMAMIGKVSNVCILGGTRVHDYFYYNNLINEMIITLEPIVFGAGLPLFSKIKWNDVLQTFLYNGFKKKKYISLNKQGTKYLYLSKI